MPLLKGSVYSSCQFSFWNYYHFCVSNRNSISDLEMTMLHICSESEDKRTFPYAFHLSPQWHSLVYITFCVLCTKSMDHCKGNSLLCWNRLLSTICEGKTYYSTDFKRRSALDDRYKAENKKMKINCTEEWDLLAS